MRFVLRRGMLSSRLLSMEHITPKKSLGQNFLVDRNIAAKIVREFAPGPGDLVVEIGPGEGALTGLLAASPAHVVAIELDHRAVERLRADPGERIEVIEADLLTFDLERLAAERKVERLRVIGNIPYYITSPILFHLIDARHAISDAMLMMQKEVAVRLVAPPRTKEYGILAVMAQTYTRVRRLFDVGPRAFHPSPRVTSSVVRFVFADIEAIAGIESVHRAIVRAAFSQRRKTLRNSLRSLIPDESERARILIQATVRDSARAEELSPEDFVRLAGVYAAAIESDRR